MGYLREILTQLADATHEVSLKNYRGDLGGYKYSSAYQYVLKRGHTYKSAKLTTAERKRVLSVARRVAPKWGCNWERKECFFNAQALVDHGRCDMLQYCEGYFIHPPVPIPVHHAWVSVNGKVVDLTLRLKDPPRSRRKFNNRIMGEFPKEYEFIGVEIPHEKVLDFFLSGVQDGHAEYASVIEDFWRGAPLLKETG